MTDKRFKIENEILNKFFPNSFQFFDMGGKSSYLEVKLKSNSKQQYTIKVTVAEDYPNRMPKIYITQPEDLKDFRGRKLVDMGAVHKLHLLHPKGNFPQLCHFKPANWNANVSLYKVVLKARIWIEAFEAHKRTGKTLDHFVKS